MRLTINIVLQSDYHIGAGHGMGTQIDSALQRDADQLPVLRSAPKGLLRDGLWHLLQTPPLARWRRCKASGFTEDGAPPHCSAAPCPLCAIFGVPSIPHLERWTFSSARPVGTPLLQDSQWRRGQTGSQVTSRVRVDPRQRRAAARQLFSQEEGDKRLAFTFRAECAANDADAHHQAALIAAAARMVRRMGAARRRGRGECLVSVDHVDGWRAARDSEMSWQAHLLHHFKLAWLERTPPQVTPAPRTWLVLSSTSHETPKQLRIVVRLDEPCVLARRAEAGNIFDCRHVISGPTILGALAAEAAKRWNLKQNEPYTAFLKIFREGQVRFSSLFPVYQQPRRRHDLYPAIPVPRDLLVCKVHQLDQGHLPLKSYAVNSVPAACPACGQDIPLVSPRGFVALPHGVGMMTPNVREEIHPRIDPPNAACRFR